MSRQFSLRLVLVVASLGVVSLSRVSSVTAAAPPSAATFAIGYRDLSVGYRAACGVKTNGTVRCWGYNEQGELGSTQAEYSRGTVPIAGITTATAVSVGEYHACVALANGQAKCWGSNSLGQLGNRSTATSLTPVTVVLADGTPLAGVVDVAASKEGTCALLADKTVTCWGSGYDGLLGDGTQDDRTYAGPAVTLSDVLAIDATYSVNRACAVLTDGTAHCWGKSAYTGTRSRTPVQKSGITGATSISVGPYQQCVTIAGNDFRCWNDTSAPADSTQVSGDIFTFSGQSATSIGLGSASCLVLPDASAKCWGTGWNGVLGTGNTSDRTTPVPVKSSSSAALSGVARIEPGDALTCALMVDTSIQCWGFSGYTARPWATWGTTETGFAGPISDSGPIRIDSIEYVKVNPATNKPGLKLTVSGIQYCSTRLGYEPEIKVDIGKTSDIADNIGTSSGSLDGCDGTGPFTVYYGLDAAYSRHLTSELEGATTYYYRVRILSGFGDVVEQIRSFVSFGKKAEIILQAPTMKQTTGSISFYFDTDGLAVTNTECLVATDRDMTRLVSMGPQGSTMNSGTGTCSFTNLSEGTTFYFKLRLTNAMGTSDSVVREMKTLKTPGVSINSGALYTNKAAVALDLSLPDGASVSISNDGGFRDAKTLTFPSSPVPWTLDSAGDERLPKTVYVRVSVPGSDTVTITDDIILDTTAPKMSTASASTTTSTTGAVKVAGLFASKPRSGGVKLTIRAVDKNSGLGTVEVKSSAGGRTVKVPVSSPSASSQTVRLVTTKKRLWVRVIDRAGNASAWKVVNIK